MGSILNFVFTCDNYKELTNNIFNGSLKNSESEKNWYQRSAILGYLLNNPHSHTLSFKDSIDSTKLNFYLLECQSSLRDLFGVGHGFETEFGKSIVKNLSPKILKAVKDKKCKILVTSISEPTDRVDRFRIQFDLFLKEFGFSHDDFIFVDSNREIEYLNKIYNREIFYTIEHFIYDGATNYFNILNSENYSNDLNYKPTLYSDDELKNDIDRRYTFLSLNRSNWKIHRTILGCYLNRKNYDNILWSYITNPSQKYLEDFNHLDYFSEWPSNLQELVKEEIINLENVVPKEIDTQLTDNKQGFKTSDTFSEQITKDCYFEIVTESSFFGPIFFSEKIVKPIIMMHPFILIASKGTLKSFQDLGFKTFDGLFDESYDKIHDSIERINFILSEIDRISRLSKSEVMDLYKRYFDICIYNRNHLLTNFYNENFYTNFFEKISSNIKNNIL